MNGRIIKAYIEMTKSQTKNTPLNKPNPKIVSRKVKSVAKQDDTKNLTR